MKREQHAAKVKTINFEKISWIKTDLYLQIMVKPDRRHCYGQRLETEMNFVKANYTHEKVKNHQLNSCKR